MGEQELADYRAMLRLRLFEEQVRDLRTGGEVSGSVHLGIGQEAIPVGAAPLIGPDDAVFATYRGHGWALALGVPAEALFGELMGRESGVNGGRGGSAYLSAPEHRFFGENSIVGAGAPLATGAALAGRFDGTNRVSLSVFGDGAMNQGSVHESMNFASAMKLPVVFLCENNYWSEMTPISDAVGDDNLYLRANAYGMPGDRVDGNDPSAVRERMEEAFALARGGGGPSLVEATTARLVGHYVGDAEQYRRPGELDAAREQEPIVQMSLRLEAAGIRPSQINELEEAVRAELQAAAHTARSSPLADAATARHHVYA